MHIPFLSRSAGRALVVAAVALGSAQAGADQLITNGGFEADAMETYAPAGWTVVEDGLLGGVMATGATSAPASGYATVGAASGNYYGLLDNAAPSTLALGQSFAVGPQALASATLSFGWFTNVQAPADSLVDHPAGLDYTTGGSYEPNQHVRVDILHAGADAFSTQAGDLVFSAFLGTAPGAGPNAYASASFDLTGVLNAGQSYQLRFASVGNLGAMQTGIDNVSLEVTPVPEPETYALLLSGLGLVAMMARRRRR